MPSNLLQHSSVVVRQRKELAEFFGFETRNKYEIFDENGNLLFFCAEMQKGIFGFFIRQMLGHWRSFELHFFDSQRQMLWRAIHPFRWFFQQLEVVLSNGESIGYVERRWSLFRKRFALITNKSEMQISSGLFSIWAFPVLYRGREVGKIQKKWSGALREIFTDADNFLVEFSPELSEEERKIVLTTAILVDLTYFENKAGGSADLLD